MLERAVASSSRGGFVLTHAEHVPFSRARNAAIYDGNDDSFERTEIRSGCRTRRVLGWSANGSMDSQLASLFRSMPRPFVHAPCAPPSPPAAVVQGSVR